MPAKLVVTARKGGSRIALLGASGKELLSSEVFTEPRAKGATLRALKGLLGEVTVEDFTLSGPGRAKDDEAPAPAGRPGRKPAAAVKTTKAGAVKVSPASARPARKATATKATATKATKKVTAAKATAKTASTPKAAAARRQAAARSAGKSRASRA